MPPGGIRIHNLSRRAAADLRLRPRGHWDRQNHTSSGQGISGFEPIISAGERPQTYALDRAATGTFKITRTCQICCNLWI